MTKLNSIRKTERKQLKRQKYDQIYFYETEDFDENIEIVKISKSRIPSKQQYKRFKNTKFIQKFTAQSLVEHKYNKKGNVRSQTNKEIINDLKTKTPRLSDFSDDNAASRRNSCFSFHIQTDWMDFEDTENVHFVSEVDIDLSKVFKYFDDKEISNFGVFDDLCLQYEVPENNLSSWAEDLSTHRYDHALSTIYFIEEIIKSNYTSIFNHNFKATLWSNCLGDSNKLLIFCESNKYLLQDIMTKEYSISMQTNCLKWTELGTKCSLIKSCLEQVVNVNERKLHLDATLCVLYEQCISILDHGMVYPDPLVVRIIDGIKKILSNLKFQYNKIKVDLEDLFDLSENCSMITLDIILQDITLLEERRSSNNQLKSVIESIGIYLGKQSNWNQEPKYGCSHFVNFDMSSENMKCGSK